jgi:hypothetical protein
MENNLNRGIRVLLADSKPMQNQLLAVALRRQGFEVLPCNAEIGPILEIAERSSTDVAVLSCSGVQTAGTHLAALHFSPHISRHSKSFPHRNGRPRGGGSGVPFWRPRHFLPGRLLIPIVL